MPPGLRRNSRSTSPLPHAWSMLCWLVVASTAWPQDDEAALDPDQPLSADALASWVLRENAGLDAAEAAAEAAAHRIEPAGALEDPMLSYGRAPLASGQTVEVSQRLPWPGTLAAREDAARHEAAAADLRVGAERLALASAAKSAFADWYFVSRALEVNREVRRLLDELIATTETRYAAGRALQQDVLQAAVELAELEAQTLELQRERTAVLAHINALLNRAPDAPLPPAAPITVSPAVLDADSLERLALDRHPSLDGLDAEIGAAGSRVTLARKAFRPSFQFRAGYNEMWSNPDMRPMLGLSVNLPVGRGKRWAELDRALAERRRAEATLRDERARLRAEVARARAEVAEAAAAIELYEARLVPLASRYLDAALADYRSGAGAFLNVVTAEQRRLTTELALERARADYVRRAAELESLIGGPVDTSTPPATRGENP